MNNEHSILPPSSASAWKKCTLWVTMNQMYPQQDTEESIEGNAAHWVLVQKLTFKPVKVGDLTPQDIFVTDEMIQGADLVINHINKLELNFNELIIERKVDCSNIHPLCFGTPDIYHFDIATYTLNLIDYKYGHRFVDEYENDQCVIYVEGILKELSATYDIPIGILDQFVNVNISIIQPRCYYKGSAIKTWKTEAINFRGLVNIIRASALKGLGPNPEALPGEYCTDCPGKHACTALQRDAYKSASLSTVSLPLELPLNAASLELKMLESAKSLLDARIKGLTEYVLNKIKSGGKASFHHISQTAGRKEWSIPVEEIIALGSALGMDFSKLETITPSQAIKAGAPEEIIDIYSKRKPGAVKLEPDNPNDIMKIFGE